MVGDNGRKRGEWFLVTAMKDTGTKPKGGRIKGGWWGLLGWGEWWKMETIILEHQ